MVKQSQSKVHTRLEISCPYPKLPEPKGKGVWGKGSERVLTNFRGLIRAIRAVPLTITPPALGDTGDLVSAGKLLGATSLRG